MLALLASCSKDYIEEEIVFNTTPIKQEVQEVVVTSTQVQSPVLFQSLSERYSPVNETTGWFNNQSNFKRYLSDSEQLNLNFIVNDCEEYLFASQDHLSFDFNNDGNLDLFAFLYLHDRCSSSYNVGQNPGKFMIIDNYYNGGTDKYYFDTDYVSMGGSTHLNDIDNDGDLEIIIYPNNRHEYNYNNSLPARDILIVEVDQSFNLTQYELPFTPFDFHDGTSGDIDNDGDIDLIKIRVGQYAQDINQYYPKVLINNNGVFQEEYLLENHQEFKELFPGGLNVTSYKLADLNSDGNLDLVLAKDIGTLNHSQHLEGQDFFYYNDDLLVLWGNGSGKFNTNNSTLIEDSNYKNELQFVLAISFTDYNLDGHLDIITSSTVNNYEGFILNLFKNNGDNSFTDLTSEVFDVSSDNGSFFYEMYKLYSIDRDNDGDFDLVPGDSHAWGYWTGKDPVDNLYWEYDNGRYIINIFNNNN